VPRSKNWWPEIGFAAGFALITVAAALGWTAPADEAVRDFARAHQHTALWWAARVLNYLGQGAIVTWVAAGGLTLWTWWRHRTWKAFVPWAAAFALTYLTLGPIKLLTMRASPNYDQPHAAEFFNEIAKADGYAMGFPSGHVVNAIVWWGVVTLLWRPVPWLRIVPPVTVVATTVYLGHHWLTDNLAALALGLLLDRLVHRIANADRLALPATHRPVTRAGRD